MEAGVVAVGCQSRSLSAGKDFRRKANLGWTKMRIAGCKVAWHSPKELVRNKIRMWCACVR